MHLSSTLIITERIEVKPLKETNEDTVAPKQNERDKLEQEKAKLAKELGIWGEFNPVENYQATEQFSRINEIDKRLFEIING